VKQSVFFRNFEAIFVLRFSGASLRKVARAAGAANNYKMFNLLYYPSLFFCPAKAWRRVEELIMKF
jgi:hypothetical protein